MAVTPMPDLARPRVEWAQWYAAVLGWRIFPVQRSTNKKKDKAPYTKHGFKDASTDPAQIAAWWEQYPEANIALALPEGWLVVDVDARNDGLVTLRSLQASYHPLPPTLTNITGSGEGSAHYCFLMPEGTDTRGKLGQGLDIRVGLKNYIILPPSHHISGRYYAWESDYGPDDIAPQPAPDWLLALLAQPSTGNGSANGYVPGDPIFEGDRERVLLSIGGRLLYEGKPAAEVCAAMAHTNTTCCVPPLRDSDIQRLARNLYKYDARHKAEAAQLVGVKPLAHTNIWMGENKDAPANDTPPSSQSLAVFPWYDKHIKPFMTKTGKIEANNTTLMAVLQNHPDWKGHLWWDDMASKLMRDEAEITDAGITEIGAELGYKFKLPVHSDALLQRCLVAVCQEPQNKRDPLKHWLSDLPPWDGEKRLETWLLDCAGLTQTPYHQFCSKILPVSMIARALDPGCICRYVLILEGPEEYRKSTFVASLVPRPEWCDELTGSLDNKEAHLMVQGLWVAELAELDSLPRTEETKLKSFISMRVDAHIPKFKSMRVRPLRRTIFVGTTNDSCYLPPGGNTRFFPLSILQPMDVEGFLAIRDQLYAEAMQYYYGNPKQWWRMSPEAETEAMGQREQRRQASLIEDDFYDWLTVRRFREYATRTPPPIIEPIKHETSLREIMLYYYNLEDRDKWNTQLMRQVYAALKALGWKPFGTTRNGEKVRLWAANPLSEML